MLVTFQIAIVAYAASLEASQSFDSIAALMPSFLPAQFGEMLMTFRGMSATADGGSFAGMFATRDYGYDDSFLWLPPPWFPVVEDAYTVLFFRELPSGT